MAYSYHNLPEVADFGEGDEVHWVYLASGERVGKRVYADGALLQEFAYLGGACSAGRA